jgi:hypothetical protein
LDADDCPTLLSSPRRFLIGSSASKGMSAESGRAAFVPLDFGLPDFAPEDFAGTLAGVASGDLIKGGSSASGMYSSLGPSIRKGALQEGQGTRFPMSEAFLILSEAPHAGQATECDCVMRDGPSCRVNAGNTTE